MSATHEAVVELVRQAEEMLGEVPSYRSPAWLALEPTDLRRIAAVWRAAEAWFDHRSPESVLADLLAMVETDRRVMESRFAEASHDASRAFDWAAASRRPTYAELQRRRST